MSARIIGTSMIDLFTYRQPHSSHDSHIHAPLRVMMLRTVANYSDRITAALSLESGQSTSTSLPLTAHRPKSVSKRVADGPSCQSPVECPIGRDAEEKIFPSRDSPVLLGEVRTGGGARKAHRRSAGCHSARFQPVYLTVELVELRLKLAHLEVRLARFVQNEVLGVSSPRAR